MPLDYDDLKIKHYKRLIEKYFTAIPDFLARLFVYLVSKQEDPEEFFKVGFKEVDHVPNDLIFLEHFIFKNVPKEQFLSVIDQFNSDEDKVREFCSLIIEHFSKPFKSKDGLWDFYLEWLSATREDKKESLSSKNDKIAFCSNLYALAKENKEIHGTWWHYLYDKNILPLDRVFAQDDIFNAMSSAKYSMSNRWYLSKTSYDKKLKKLKSCQDKYFSSSSPEHVEERISALKKFINIAANPRQASKGFRWFTAKVGETASMKAFFKTLTLTPDAINEVFLAYSIKIEENPKSISFTKFLNKLRPYIDITDIEIESLNHSDNLKEP